MKWATAKIGEECDVPSGATPRTGEPAFWDGDILWAIPKDLSDLDRKYLNDTARKITTAGLKSCPQQIRFVETIIDQLTAHGVMEPSALYEPPFTRIDFGGPDALFDGRENVVAGIFETLDAINSGLYDEGTSLRVARGKSGGTMHCESV